MADDNDECDPHILDFHGECDKPDCGCFVDDEGGD